MDNTKDNHLIPTNLFDGVRSLLRRILFKILAFGPMPRHIAVIPDGNRRYGRKMNLREGEAHRAGMTCLMSFLKYCHEMGVQCVSVYGFSIDNFRRKPNEVQAVMAIIQEHTEALIHNTGVVNELGLRVRFLGNLDLLDEPMRAMARRAMDVTAANGKLVLLVCLAYSSSHEIAAGVQGSCREKLMARAEGEDGGGPITVEDLEKNMFFSGQPEPDILIRTSGETRLSNFMLWQSAYCLLYAPRCLWPEISLRHVVWGVLEYQRNYQRLEKIKKQL